MTGIVKKKIDNRSIYLLLFFMCWLAYTITYIGRLNFNASIAAILQSEPITKSQAGLISTGSFFAYGVGQLINGTLCDRVSPKWMMFCGLTVSAAVNVGMGFAASVPLMVVLWCVNGYAQSMTWSPVMKLFSDLMQRKNRTKALVNISTAVPIGTLAAYGLSALLIAVGSWRMVFFAAAGIVFVMAVVWLAGVTKVERHTAAHGIVEEEMKAGVTVSGRQIPFKKLMISSGILIIGIAVVMHGILKDGVTTWAPTYLTELFGVGASISILATTLLPIINLAGVYGASLLNQKVFHNELITSTAFFVLAAAAMVLLITVGVHSMVLAVILLAVITSSMMGINTLMINLLPLSFASAGRSSTATGILNSFTYLGSAISSYGIGAVSQSCGWGVTVAVWIGICAVGLVVCVAFHRRWNRFRLHMERR